jgi:hypothetical protein
MIRLSAIMAEAISSGQNQVSVPQDLQPAQAAEFSWAEGQRLSSLKKLRDIVANKIDITAGWYMRGKKGRRIFGRFARVGAMVLATLAAASLRSLKCIDRRTIFGFNQGSPLFLRWQLRRCFFWIGFLRRRRVGCDTWPRVTLTLA